MANKSNGRETFAPVLAAVATMQGNASRSEKSQAHEFLEKFQKSVLLLESVCFLICDLTTNVIQMEAWSATHALLQSADVSIEAKLFAATTLKGKVRYFS